MSRTRAGLLLAAVSLVGGTGCISAYINKQAEDYASARSDKEWRRHVEEQRHRRVVALRPAAQAGDPVAMTALAYALMAANWPNEKPLQEALTLLGRATQQGHGQAQAILGDALSRGFTVYYNGVPTRNVLADPKASLPLLQKAAVQACSFSALGDKEGLTYKSPNPATIHPAEVIARVLATENPPQSRVWAARAALHCSQLPENLSHAYSWRHMKPQEVVDALALVLLTSEPDVAQAERGITHEQLAAAEREAADLRRRVAESERDYPAPKHRKLP